MLLIIFGSIRRDAVNAVYVGRAAPGAPPPEFVIASSNATRQSQQFAWLFLFATMVRGAHPTWLIA